MLEGGEGAAVGLRNSGNVENRLADADRDRSAELTVESIGDLLRTLQRAGSCRLFVRCREKGDGGFSRRAESHPVTQFTAHFLDDVLDGEIRQVVCGIRGVGITDQRHEHRADERKVQKRQLLLHFLGRHGAANQAVEKAFLQDRKALCELLGQTVEPALSVPFAVQLPAHPVEQISYLACGDGLEQEIAHLELHRFLGILELVVAGQENRLGGRVLFGDGCRQLQPIHEGHAYVGKDDIGSELLHGL